jgi:hypothetical protein
MVLPYVEARDFYPECPEPAFFAFLWGWGALKIEQKGAIVPVPNGQTEIAVPLLPFVARSLLWVLHRPQPHRRTPTLATAPGKAVCVVLPMSWLQVFTSANTAHLGHSGGQER